MVINADAVVGSRLGLQYQADDKGRSIEICRNGLIGDDPEDWHRQMRSIENRNNRVKNKRLVVFIAPSKEVSGKLSLEDWNLLVEEYLKKMKIDKENYQYIAHYHSSTDDKHCHLTISRIPMQSDKLSFPAINDRLIGKRSGQIADEIATERNWHTAKQIAEFKRTAISEALRAVLKSAVNFQVLREEMRNKGFEVILSENKAKGIYVMRIVPTEDINEMPSERAQRSKSGYKLSEIKRFENKKATYTIAEVKRILEVNLYKSLTFEEKVKFLQDKNESLFYSSEKSIAEAKQPKDINNHEESKRIQNNNFIEELLKPSYVAPAEDDLFRRKKRKGR